MMDKYAIQDGNINNFDETGFQMGILSGAKVVTSRERRGRPRAKQPGNWEWVTVIQAVCADGWIVPPYFVVKGKNHLLPWYQDSRFQPEWRAHTSENGWTTNEIGVDWLKHFDQSTKRRTRGVHRLLILDGHDSHHSVVFEDFCKANNIVTLCMPPHSSHFLQPLDVGCFSPLEASSYDKQIKRMMRMQITHITKEDDFDAFVEAFHASITANNIRAGFRASGLVPFDPESVVSRLDPKPITPSPPSSRPGTTTSWVPKTPSNAQEAKLSSSTLKRMIENHQGSSPTHIFDIIDLQAKSISKLAHGMVLLRAETKELRTANERLSKRRKTKKTRLQDGGSLSLQEATTLMGDKGFGGRDCEETSRSGGRTTAGELRVRLCSNCKKPGHKARTCQVVCETSEDSDSE
jgi:AraC-like DNA-binding protein